MVKSAILLLVCCIGLIECAPVDEARLKRALCHDSHPMCSTWAESQECAKNPDWMFGNCKRSCGQCVDHCVDANTKCRTWAQAGECARNPSWMNVNCKASCGVCSSVKSTNFAQPVSKGTVSGPVNEASGLAASERHPGYLYTLNDSGGRNRLFALSAATGRLVGILTINGATNIDWEDLAVGPCGDTYEWCIFIADTGANIGRSASRVYKVREPSHMGDQTINVVDSFHYAWNEPDCESVMVDHDGQVYLISKVHAGNKPGLYPLPAAGWGKAGPVYLQRAATIPITSRVHNPVAADISHHGTEILIKAYDHVYYWFKGETETIASALSRKPNKELPISRAEKQGETIAWSISDDGYYTLSEGYNQKLYYYKRQ